MGSEKAPRPRLVGEVAAAVRHTGDRLADDTALLAVRRPAGAPAGGGT
ncbi:hypothetical protein ACFZDG_39340 [Kitasatospora xanthocidica]